MAEADYRMMTDETGQRIAEALEAFQAVPYVATIPTGQWSGSGNDRYITVQASNVTANSLLVPHYDSASEALLNGPIWCVPAAGSFTIHTSAIPAGTVTVMVQLLGTLGEAQYQVLSDVYSKSQTDALVAQSTAFEFTTVSGTTTADGLLPLSLTTWQHVIVELYSRSHICLLYADDYGQYFAKVLDYNMAKLASTSVSVGVRYKTIM